jgi:hypothetical protein
MGPEPPWKYVTGEEGAPPVRVNVKVRPVPIVSIEVLEVVLSRTLT